MTVITPLLRLFIAFALALRASSIVILIPLYVFPTASPNSWQPLYDAIASNPGVQWQIVINPNTGPGPDLCPGAPGNTVATRGYQNGIAKLHSYPNTAVLGYVDTRHGRKSVDDVIADIDIYASWWNCRGAKVSIDGIFFDDFANDTAIAPVNQMTTAYAQAISEHVYDTIPSDAATVIFNPGHLISSQTSTFFSYADTIVTFESPASSYSSPGTLNSIRSMEGSLPPGQSAILIHSAPPSLNPQAWVQDMISQGVGAFYITQSTRYNSLNGRLLAQLAAAVAAG